jgi:hypothetical protein
MASNGSVRKRNTNGLIPEPIGNLVNYSRDQAGISRVDVEKSEPGMASMVVCVAGIYGAL